MAASPPAYLYCEETDIRDWLSDLAVDARLDDDLSGVIETAEAGLITRCRRWGTNKVNQYCVPLYAVEDLAQSYAVLVWATIFAAHALCTRRLNPCPDVVREYAFGDGSTNRGALGDLEDVKRGDMEIWDIGKRSVPWPAWSNLRLDARFSLRQQRVQRQLSEKTPTQYTQVPDYYDEYGGP